MIPSNGNQSLYGIEELAEKGGVSRRTVRYYVQRGLLPAPTGTGRGPHYTEGHLAKLIHIRQLQEQGVPLADIPARLEPPGPQPPEPEPVPAPSGAPRPWWWPPPPQPPIPVEPRRTVWTRIVLADGVELHVRSHPDALDPVRLARLAEAVHQILGPQFP
jgi:DNA-binding transcriptional MerR regulator